MLGLTLAGAFIGGILTLLSPCSVMLLPAFFSYAFGQDKKLISRTGIFYLGLLATLVPLGVLAGSVGAFMSENRGLLIVTAAVIVLVLGLVQVAGVNLPFFPSTDAANDASSLSVFLLGTVYGLSGACSGPILGSVLTLAAIGGNAIIGAVTLIFFAGGMVVPLLIIAALWQRFAPIQRWLRPKEIKIGAWRNTWTQVISGVFAIALGIFLLLTRGVIEGGILGASKQFELENWAMQATSAIPNWLVLSITGVIVISIVALRVGQKHKKVAAPGRIDLSLDSMTGQGKTKK